MALTRKLLEGLGIESDKVTAIIEAHSETVDALKAQIDSYKKDSDTLKSTQKELEDLKKNTATDGDWKTKFEKEHADFEAFKNTQAEKDAVATKRSAYRELLKTSGVSEKRLDSILKVTDLKELEYKDGKFTKESEIVAGIKTEWSDFITSKSKSGAELKNPPNPSGGAMTLKDIYAKDDKGRYKLSTAERQKALKDNPSLIGRGE